MTTTEIITVTIAGMTGLGSLVWLIITLAVGRVQNQVDEVKEDVQELKTGLNQNLVKIFGEIQAMRSDIQKFQLFAAREFLTKSELKEHQENCLKK